MKLYQLIDSESHLIAAHDVAEAMGVYLNLYGDGEDETPRISEIPSEKWKGIKVRDDDYPGGVVTADVLVESCGEKPGLVGSTAE